MSFVYISHASTDKAKLRHVVDALVAAGIKVWIDNPSQLGYAQPDIVRSFEILEAGARWADAMEDALHRAGAVLVCWSRGAIDSDFVLREASFARIAQKLVSCRIDDVDVASLPSGFNQEQIADVRATLPPSQLEALLRLLADDIKRMLAGSARQRVFSENQEKQFLDRPVDLFISYRREDEPHAAARLYMELANTIPKDRIFMDIDGIPLGQNFVRVIQERVANCKMLLAVVGRKWVKANRPVKWLGLSWSTLRLKDPKDFVRIEICTAMERSIPIIPVLVDTAAMPADAELPAAMQGFENFQAARVSHHSFAADAKVLADGIAEAKKYTGSGRR